MHSIIKHLLTSICVASMSLAAQNPAATEKPSTPPAASMADPVLKQHIEQNLRARFKIPSRVSLEIGERTPSEFAGYDQITVTLVAQGRKSSNTFLLSKDGKTLAQISKMDVSKDPFAIENRPTRGTADAKVKIVVYDDFECPFCAKGYLTLFHEVFPDYKDKILVTFKDFPLSEIHPWAIHAAVDANCLGTQSTDAYWAFSDYVHENQKQINGDDKNSLPNTLASLDRSVEDYGKQYNLDVPRLEACVKAQDETAVRDSMKYAEQSLGVDSTPTLFVNGTKLDGAPPAPELRRILNNALEQAGVPVPPAAKAEGVGEGGKPADAKAGKAVQSPLGAATDSEQDARKKADPAPAPAAEPKKQ